jgi:hypothetical protein
MLHFSISIMHHPACVANAEWYAQAYELLQMMDELQGQIAEAHIGSGEDEDEPEDEEPPPALPMPTSAKGKKKRK